MKSRNILKLSLLIGILGIGFIFNRHTKSLKSKNKSIPNLLERLSNDDLSIIIPYLTFFDCNNLISVSKKIMTLKSNNKLWQIKIRSRLYDIDIDSNFAIKNNWKIYNDYVKKICQMLQLSEWYCHTACHFPCEARLCCHIKWHREKCIINNGYLYVSFLNSYYPIAHWMWKEMEIYIIPLILRSTYKTYKEDFNRKYACAEINLRTFAVKILSFPNKTSIKIEKNKGKFGSTFKITFGLEIYDILNKNRIISHE